MVPEGTKGGKRPTAANHRTASFAYESNGIKPDSARSRQPEADCFRLYIQRLPLNGIYYHLSHMRCIPRFFACGSE